MTRVIRTMTLGLQVDVRELIVQRESTTPAHLSGDYRPRVAEILENYEIDESLTDPPPNIVGLFDDILTAGSHFRAAKLLLQQDSTTFLSLAFSSRGEFFLQTTAQPYRSSSEKPGGALVPT